MDIGGSEQSESLFGDIRKLSDRILRPDIGVEESQAFYNTWASLGTYDKLSEEAGFFAAHDALMAGVLQLFPSARDVRVLDVGAGTGLIGQKLRDEGFLNVDALDPSPEMLKASEKKGVYRRLISCFFTETPIPQIAQDTYDLLVMCGVFCPGMVRVQAFEEALRILKPGGFIVNCMRAEFLDTVPEYRDGWRKEVERLTGQGRWRLVSEVHYPNHYLQHQGLRMVYQKL